MVLVVNLCYAMLFSKLHSVVEIVQRMIFVYVCDGGGGHGMFIVSLVCSWLKIVLNMVVKYWCCFWV